MNELQKLVRQAHRRNTVRRFLRALGWCWSATLLVALALILVDKFYLFGTAIGRNVLGWFDRTLVLGVSVEAGAGLTWQVLALAGSLLMGATAAATWAYLTRRPSLTAAIEIDQRFQLKERISSALALPADQRETEAGQALVADAMRRAERVDVGSQFSMSPGRGILLPLVPGLLAVLIALLVSPAVVENPAQAKADPAEVRQQVKRSTDALRRKMQQRREEAKKMGLKDAEQMFDRLLKGSKDMEAKPSDRKQTLVKLNELARQIQSRRKQVGGADEIRKQLNQMKNIDRGPADKFSKAVADGNFKQAIEELKKLQQQMAKGDLNDEQKQQLARQMEQMQKRLERLAEAHQQAMDNLQKQVDQARQNGQNEMADKLAEQLAKLQQQMPQMDQLRDMADQLNQCAQCMKDGQPEDAAQAMQNMQNALNDLQQQADELKVLEDAMEQLADARNQMNCPACQGAGCEMCQAGQGGSKAGRGHVAQGPPGEEIDATFYDTKVRQQVRPRGDFIVTDLVDGPNTKGRVGEVVKQEFQPPEQGSTDPLSGVRMPRKHSEFAREYFDKFREGE